MLESEHWNIWRKNVEYEFCKNVECQIYHVQYGVYYVECGLWSGLNLWSEKC